VFRQVGKITSGDGSFTLLGKGSGARRVGDDEMQTAGKEVFALLAKAVESGYRVGSQ
jgi:hypothetical protein